MEILIILEYIGLFVFVFTGAYVAAKIDLDFVGMLFLGFITGVGGGTIRDIILGVDVFWLDSYPTLIVIFLATIMCFFFNQYFEKMKKFVFFFDTLGLALFACLGTHKALLLNMNYGTAILMGVISGVLGGVLRSLFTKEDSIVFKKEVYATSAALGSVSFIALTSIGQNFSVSITIGALTCIVVRYVSVRFNIHLPKAR
jgi:uncharacterized membrane protein YeiH